MAAGFAPTGLFGSRSVEAGGVIANRTSGVKPRSAVFPFASDDVLRTSLGRRKTAVVYPFPMTVRYETTITGAPGVSSLGQPQEMRGDGWTVRMDSSPSGATLKATWEATRSHDRFGPDAFPELKKFWAAVDATADTNLSIR